MNIKLKDILNNTESIRSLQTINLPIKISYRIKRLSDKLDPIIKSYEEKRNELIREFGTENEDKTLSVKNPEKVEQFMAKIMDIQEVEEIVEFEPISVKELGDILIPAKDLVSFIFSE